MVPEIDVARSLPTFWRFLEARYNTAIQRTVCFDNVQIIGRTHLFQRKNGLLNNCAKACNPLAEHLLAQVILAICTQLLHINMEKDRLNYFRHYISKYSSRRGKACEDGVAASFIAHFTPVPGSNPENAQESDPNTNSRPLSFHWEFLKSFISNCTRGEIEHMGTHLHSYLELFACSRSNSPDVSSCLNLVDTMYGLGTTRERNLLWYKEKIIYWSRAWPYLFEQI